MQTEMIPYSLAFGLIGIWIIGNGLWLTLGINRTWWRWRLLPFQEGYFWAGIPLGVATISWAIAILLPQGSTIQGIFFWGGLALIFVGIIFSLGPPRLVKPKWLRDLEERYPTYHDMKYLREQARNLDTRTWLEIVHDPDRLQQWADDEIRTKMAREYAEIQRK